MNSQCLFLSLEMHILVVIAASAMLYASLQFTVYNPGAYKLLLASKQVKLWWFQGDIGGAQLVCVCLYLWTE